MKLEEFKMTKMNAAALSEKDMDMVTGGGFLSELKEMREAAKIKEDESTVSKVVKGTVILGLVGTVVGLIVTKGA